MGGGFVGRLSRVLALPFRGGHGRGSTVPAGSLMRGDDSVLIVDRADACERRGDFCDVR